MQITLEIDDKTMSKVDSFSPNRAEYCRKAIQEKLLRDENTQLSYDQKVKRTVESYQKLPQQPEEFEIWQDEQVWGDE